MIGGRPRIGGTVIGGTVIGGTIGGVAHVGLVIVLVSRLTWPLRASTRPATVVPVCTVAEVNAMTLPTKVVLVPSVAELPTCQNTLHGCAPLMRATVLFDAVISVDPA